VTNTGTDIFQELVNLIGEFLDSLFSLFSSASVKSPSRMTPTTQPASVAKPTSITPITYPANYLSGLATNQISKIPGGINSLFGSSTPPISSPLAPPSPGIEESIYNPPVSQVAPSQIVEQAAPSQIVEQAAPSEFAQTIPDVSTHMGVINSTEDLSMATGLEKSGVGAIPTEGSMAVATGLEESGIGAIPTEGSMAVATGLEESGIGAIPAEGSMAVATGLEESGIMAGGAFEVGIEASALTVGIAAAGLGVVTIAGIMAMQALNPSGTDYVDDAPGPVGQVFQLKSSLAVGLLTGAIGQHFPPYNVYGSPFQPLAFDPVSFKLNSGHQVELEKAAQILRDPILDRINLPHVTEAYLSQIPNIVKIMELSQKAKDVLKDIWDWPGGMDQGMGG
jgi:hypothetical protein